MKVEELGLPSAIQQNAHDLHSIYEEMCVIAPHPDLQEKLRARLDSMLGAPEGAAADAAPKGRKGAAKKAAKGAAKSDSKLDEMIGCLLRMRGVSKPGLDDGLIIPGSYFPLGTPVSMVRSAAADRAPLPERFALSLSWSTSKTRR